MSRVKGSVSCQTVREIRENIGRLTRTASSVREIREKIGRLTETASVSEGDKGEHWKIN